MFLTDLADTCRRAGLTVVEEPGWQQRGHGPMLGVRTIVCHHTAGPKAGDAPSLHVVRDGRADLPGPLAHLLLARSGTVHVVAAGLCWHTGATLRPDQSNAFAVGIEAEATGSDPWPVVQVQTYARLCAALCHRYALGADRVLGHKEVAAPHGRKVDPNLDLVAFRAAVGRELGTTTRRHDGSDMTAEFQNDVLSKLTDIHDLLLGTHDYRQHHDAADDNVVGQALSIRLDLHTLAAEHTARMDGIEQTLARIDAVLNPKPTP